MLRKTQPPRRLPRCYEEQNDRLSSESVYPPVERRASRDASEMALRSARRASLSLAFALFSCSRCLLANVVGLWLLGIAVLHVLVVRTSTLAVLSGLGHANYSRHPATAGRSWATGSGFTRWLVPIRDFCFVWQEFDDSASLRF